MFVTDRAPTPQCGQPDRRSRDPRSPAPRGGRGVGSRPGGRGFTLVELLVVLVIIGIIVSLILVASFDSYRSAQKKATQGLIVSLDQAYTTLYQEMLRRPFPVTESHRRVARIYVNGNVSFIPPSVTETRANIVAQLDYLKNQLPDVFVVLSPTPGTNQYPINFGALPYFQVGADVTNPVFFSAPLQELPNAPSLADSLSLRASEGYGIMGASYEVASAIYRQLGYDTLGTDGSDNDFDGLVDEWDEGTANLSAVQVAEISERLARHTHRTARSEMLYALLSQPRGSFGVSLNADLISPNLVGDTDGDGLLEFLDAWGQPIQFFRWPVHYNSPLQQGYRAYESLSESRDQNPLDPNNTLLDPSWWWSAGAVYVPATDSAEQISRWDSGLHAGIANTDVYIPNAPGDPMSGGAQFVNEYLFSLCDQNFGPDAPSIATGTLAAQAQLWNRGGFPGYAARRAYSFRHLILSGGQDQLVGVGMLDVDYPLDYSEYWQSVGSSVAAISNYGIFLNPSNPTALNLSNPGEFRAAMIYLNQVEGAAARLSPVRTDVITDPYRRDFEDDASALARAVLDSAGVDDISNHDLDGGTGGTL